MRNLILSLAVAVAAVVVAAHLGVTEWLGAHPWWAERVAYYAIAPGVVAVAALAALRLTTAPRVAVACGLLAVAYGVAHVGGARFAASYAEDAAAGRMWFFGWIGTAAMAILAVQVLVAVVTSRRA